MKCKYYGRFIIEFAGGGDFRCKFDKFEFARVNGGRGAGGGGSGSANEVYTLYYTCSKYFEKKRRQYEYKIQTGQAIDIFYVVFLYLLPIFKFYNLPVISTK